MALHHFTRHGRQCWKVYIGWPGRVHDARVFVNSSLYQKGQGGTLFPDWKQTISVVPLLVLGDPAYPLVAKGFY